MTALPSAAAFDIRHARPAHFIPNRAERPWELPPVLFAATAGGYALFVAILGLAAASDGMVVPIAICFAYLFMFFATPWLFGRVAPVGPGRFATWAEWMEEGIETWTGKCSAKAAIAQIMILPVLLVGFASAIAAIWASLL